jgi:predicted nucleic acid-binding protein
MDSYIVDASVLIQHLVNDTYTVNADALVGELGKSVEICVPDFCVLECTNVLWKRVRFDGMPQSDAELLANDLAGLPLIVAPSGEVLKRSLQIGLAHQLAVYDSVYIALAERLGHPLITVDTRQGAAARSLGITLKPVTDFSP